MSGYAEILELRRLEKEVSDMGLMMAYSRFTREEGGLALIPKDADSLPVYSRDAEVFYGSLAELKVWLRGVNWAREYDRLNKISDDDKRHVAEQKVRNKKLLQAIKGD